jgi:hypothetical protein
MSAAEPQLLRVPLRCDPSAPGLARDAIRRIGALDPVRDDAVLLVSELVSGAVIGRGADSNATLELTASEVPHGVHLAVTATINGTPPAPPEPALSWVVGALACRWGVERRDRLLQLWADLTT